MDLSIVVVNYNGEKWLKRLLPSLQTYFLEKTHYEVEVLVVDNASTDNSCSYLDSLSFVRCIRSAVNGGFAYGNNLALKDIRSRYTLLLNSDTELVADSPTLDRLLEYMDAHPQTGMLSPLVYLGDGSVDKACHRGEPTLWASICYLSGLEKILGYMPLFGKYHLTHLPLDTVHPIEACSGAAMLVRVSAVEQVGLLDERFFLYAEDLDWCKRFRENGFGIVFDPEVWVTHHKYQSGMGSTTLSEKRSSNRYFYTTMLQYYDKHYAANYPAWVRGLLRWFVERNS